MLTERKLTEEQLLRENFSDESMLEPSPWFDAMETFEGDHLHPEIVNLLGSFSEQTGAQFE